MPYPGLLHPESLFLRQSTADLYLLRTHPKTVLSQSPCGSRSWCAWGTFEPSECLWQVWGLILNVTVSLIPSFWGFFFAPGHGVSPQSHSSVMQLLLQHMIETSVSSVTQSCPTPCSPMDSSTPGLPVHHQLPEFTQIHVH